MCKYLYVFDYCTPGIFEKEMTEEDSKLEEDDLLEKYGFNSDECHYMISSEKLEIQEIE